MIRYRLTCWLGLSFVCNNLSAPPEEIWRGANRPTRLTANRSAKLKPDLAKNPAVVAFGVALGYIICGIAGAQTPVEARTAEGRAKFLFTPSVLSCLLA
jgi:hypothetical protein